MLTFIATAASTLQYTTWLTLPAVVVSVLEATEVGVDVDVDVDVAARLKYASNCS